MLQTHFGEALLDEQLARRGEDAWWARSLRGRPARSGQGPQSPRRAGGGFGFHLISYNTKRIVSMYGELEMTTQDDTRIVALIERAERETPFCDCGEPVAAIAQNREIWLRCTALKTSTGGTSSVSSPRSHLPGTRAGS